MKFGSDFVERVLYDGNSAPSTDEQLEEKTIFAKKRKIVMCTECKRIQSTVLDVELKGGAEHLYLVAADCTDLPKDLVCFLHSSDVQQHISELERELPWRLVVLTIWYGEGNRIHDVNRELKSFRADSPGNWYHLTAKAASIVISRLLFGSEEQDDIEPGITIESENVNEHA